MGFTFAPECERLKKIESQSSSLLFNVNAGEINQFQASVPFLYPLKTSKVKRFFDVFRGYVGLKWVKYNYRWLWKVRNPNNHRLLFNVNAIELNITVLNITTDDYGKSVLQKCIEFDMTEILRYLTDFALFGERYFPVWNRIGERSIYLNLIILKPK